MKVSWDWLKQYTTLDRSVDDMAHMLSMSGLNHEGAEEVDGDLVLDLEVTSNRPDCLGHIGVAREWAALVGQPLVTPAVELVETEPACAELTSVEVHCPDLCPRYIARVVRNVTIGPSPVWMVRRLKTVGIPSINNVVDVTNYVMMECGQPLHAFDYDKLVEHRIVVRRAAGGETITAIDGRGYELDDSMCIIADAVHPVAIAGVMGGLATEISDATTMVLLESADFDPLSVRRASRAIGLLSESSFRFERGVDPLGVDWASQRAAQLIADLGGGEIATGSCHVGDPIGPREAITLPFSLVKRILGIDIPAERACRILEALDLAIVGRSDDEVRVMPPTYRRDLLRPIDLVEEVGRLYGYDHLPTDARMPVTVAQRSRRERVETTVRQTLTGCGVFEAVTYSFVDEAREDLFTPWCDRPALRVDHPSRRQENVLRKSLLASLLGSVRGNEAHGNRQVDLFEIAHVYLPVAGEQLPAEPRHLALACGRELRDVVGFLAGVCDVLHIRDRWATRPADQPFFEEGHSLETQLDGTTIGYAGQLAAAVIDQFDLQRPYVVAELDLDVLIDAADLTPQYTRVSTHPAIERDLSLVVDEALQWETIAVAVRTAAGEHLESLDFVDLYRGKPIPGGKKSVTLTLRFRAPGRTLTHAEVDSHQDAILAACQTAFGATLRQ